MSDATIWQDNARRFASRADDAIAQHQHAGVRSSLQLIATGRRDDAHEELARSVERQARLAGLGRHDLGRVRHHDGQLVVIPQEWDEVDDRAEEAAARDREENR